MSSLKSPLSIFVAQQAKIATTIKKLEVDLAPQSNAPIIVNRKKLHVKDQLRTLQSPSNSEHNSSYSHKSLTSQTSPLRVHKDKHKVSGESHSMSQIRIPICQQSYWTKQNAPHQKCFVLLINVYRHTRFTVNHLQVFMTNTVLIFSVQRFSRSFMKALKIFYKSNKKHFNGNKFRSMKTERQYNQGLYSPWTPFTLPMIFSKSHKISSRAGGSFLSEARRK